MPAPRRRTAPPAPALPCRPGTARAALVGVVLLGLLACGTALTGAWAAATDACGALTTPVRQLANPATGAALLTTSTASETAARKYGFTQDLGVVLYAATAPATGLVPVRRLLRTKLPDYLDTANTGEWTSAVSRYGYADQGVRLYAAPATSSCGAAVTRYQRQGYHRLAVTTAAGSALVKAGWKAEGVAFRAAAQAPTSVPPTSTAPTTAAPTTAAPTTAAPTTAAPTTAAPTTEAPTTTSAPSTDAATTTTAPGDPATGTTSAPATPTSTDPSTTAPAPTEVPTTSVPTTDAPTTASAAPTTPTDSPVPTIVPTDAPTPPATSDPTPVDTTFTFADLPDTQNEVVDPTRTWFADRMTWLVGHRTELDLRWVTATGDLANWDTDDHAQMRKVSDGLSVLDVAGLPYTLSIGNHDTRATGVGGSVRNASTVRADQRDTSTFNSFFPANRYAGFAGAYESGKVDNAYALYDAGGVRWMVLNLELWPRPGVVAWARQVVADHPHANVVVTTHDYLDKDGGIEQTNGGYGDTSPQYLYDNLISRYPNIKLVLSGHTGIAASRVDTGVNGNRVYSFLTTMHSGTTNPTRFFTIDTAAGTIRTWVYAPRTDQTWPEYDQTVTGVDWVR